MTDRTDQREAIIAALAAFGTRPIPDAARNLFAVLGYQSDRRLPIATPAQFREQLDPDGRLTDRENEALDGVESLHLLFQFTNAELAAQSDLFDDPNAVQATRIESYLFFAVELPPGHYTRTALSTLVRALNKPLPMPALVLFRHGDTCSVGIIHRRLHKRDQVKDVLEKVTLIRTSTGPTPSVPTLRSSMTSFLTTFMRITVSRISSVCTKPGRSASAPTRFPTTSTARSPTGISGRTIRSTTAPSACRSTVTPSRRNPFS